MLCFYHSRSLREPSRSAVLERFWLIPEAPEFSDSLEFCVKYLLFIAKSTQFYRKFGKLKKKNHRRGLNHPFSHRLGIIMNSILVHFLPVFFPSLLINMGSRAHTFTRNKSCSYLSAHHIAVRLFLHDLSFHPHNSPARSGVLHLTHEGRSLHNLSRCVTRSGFNF